MRILLKHGLGALTGSLNNRDLGDLKKYKLVRLDRIFDGSPGGGSNDSPGSEGCGFVFVGQSHWSNPGLGSPLRWALDVMQPPHIDHWPERSSRSHRELLKLLGNACIAEINLLRTNSKHPMTSNWPEILNNIIRSLPLGEVGALLGVRWDEAEDFILGSFSEEISTTSGRAVLAVRYAKLVYGGRWPKAYNLDQFRETKY